MTDHALWDVAGAALALVLVIEGLLPFVNPAAWRRLIEQATRLGDGRIRLFGLLAMLAGLGLLAFVWR